MEAAAIVVTIIIIIIIILRVLFFYVQTQQIRDCNMDIIFFFLCYSYRALSYIQYYDQQMHLIKYN